MSKAAAIGCVALTILITSGAQLVVKWQVSKAGAFPDAFGDRVEFLLKLLTNPWIIAMFAAAAVAALSWMAALTRFDLSAAYPFVSLTFVLVMLLSGVFFDEAITTVKIAGVALIVAGLVVVAQA